MIIDNKKVYEDPTTTYTYTHCTQLILFSDDCCGCCHNTHNETMNNNENIKCQQELITRRIRDFVFSLVSFQYAGSYLEDALRLLANPEFKFTMMKKVESWASFLHFFVLQLVFYTLVLLLLEWPKLKYRQHSTLSIISYIK